MNPAPQIADSTDAVHPGSKKSKNIQPRSALERITAFMRVVFCLAAVVLHLQTSVAEAATPRDSADYPADPRPVVVEFFEHIRAGDAEAAWKCWDPAVGKEKDE